MIFVTVGTHEQPFNRLIEEVDKLKASGVIEDEVIIQKGYSTYKPKYCTCYDLIPYEDMDKYIQEARIVITHGGPASFMAPLSYKKIPIVVPRQKQFNEHVNDHQLEFSLAVEQRMKNIIVVSDITQLGNYIVNYDEIAENITVAIINNNNKFCTILKTLIKENLFDNRGGG